MKWKNNSMKGYTLNDLPQVGLLIVFIGVCIAVGAYLNNEISSSSFDTEKILNEQITWVSNASYIKLAHPYLKSIEGINNGTRWLAAAPSYTSGNYSFLNDGSGVLCCKTCGTIACNENTTLWINYTTWSGEDYQVMKNATSGLTSLSVWLPIIAVVIASSVVIVTLMTSFLRRDNM